MKYFPIKVTVTPEVHQFSIDFVKNNEITTERFAQVRSLCGDPQFLTIYNAGDEDLFQRIVTDDKSSGLIKIKELPKNQK